jgi:hypothetical protein
VVGLEALIRWNHPVLGLRMPGEFLPPVENEDVIVSIGDWVIAEAPRQQASLRAAGHELTISVNIAARQLVYDREFAERLEAVLSAGGRDRLEIEILESAALEDISTVSSLITSFQQRGIRFALDDFGTGYSSLVHLKRLGADVLKIDQTFVRDMLDDPGDLAIVQGVVGLAGAFRRDGGRRRRGHGTRAHAACRRLRRDAGLRHFPSATRRKPALVAGRLYPRSTLVIDAPKHDPLIGTFRGSHHGYVRAPGLERQPDDRCAGHRRAAQNPRPLSHRSQGKAG